MNARAASRAELSRRAVERLNALPMEIRRSLGGIPIGACVVALIPTDTEYAYEIERVGEANFIFRLLTTAQLCVELLEQADEPTGGVN